jgi:hypothetical protein
MTERTRAPEKRVNSNCSHAVWNIVKLLRKRTRPPEKGPSPPCPPVQVAVPNLNPASHMVYLRALITDTARLQNELGRLHTRAVRIRPNVDAYTYSVVEKVCGQYSPEKVNCVLDMGSASGPGLAVLESLLNRNRLKPRPNGLSRRENTVAAKKSYLSILDSIKTCDLTIHCIRSNITCLTRSGVLDAIQDHMLECLECVARATPGPCSPNCILHCGV